MLYALLMLLSIIFAIMAVRAKGLIASALWLAGVSAMVAVLFYLLGARQVAVVELSVGAGLVTVLFAFAISIAGEEPGVLKSYVPVWLGGALILLMVGLFTWFTIPGSMTTIPSTEPPFITVFWQERGLDMVVQVSLIFAGVLGLIGLLAEVKSPSSILWRMPSLQNEILSWIKWDSPNWKRRQYELFTCRHNDLRSDLPAGSGFLHSFVQTQPDQTGDRPSNFSQRGHAGNHRCWLDQQSHQSCSKPGYNGDRRRHNRCSNRNGPRRPGPSATRNA